MRTYIIILTIVFCLTLSGGAYAQRCLPGMRGIQLTGGLVDGFRSINQGGQLDFYAGVAMSTYAKNTNKWVFGAEYLQRYYPYRDIQIPMSQITAEGGYYMKLLSDQGRNFLLSLGGSAIGGYEISNRGEKTLFDGSTLQNEDSFIYGGGITLELESYLTDRIVFLIHSRERVLFGSSTGKFHTQVGIGFKFLIN